MKKSIVGRRVLGMLTLFVVLSTSFVLQAQELPVYAPLLETNTNSLIRVKPGQIDLIKISGAVAKAAENVIDSLAAENVVPEDQAKQTKLMVTLGVPAAVAQFNPILTELEKNGVDEVYFVGTSEQPKISSGYVAISAEGKTEDQIKSLRALTTTCQKFNINLRYPFVRHGFLIAPLINADATDDAAIKDYIKTRFKTLDSAPNASIIEAIEANPNASLVGVTLFDEAARNDAAKAKDALLDADRQANDETDKAFIDFFIQNWDSVVDNVESVQFCCDANELSLDFGMKMKAPENARNVEGLFAQFNDKIVDEIGEQNELEPDEKNLIKSLVSLFGPNVQNETLVWRFDSAFCEKAKPFVVDYIKLMQKAGSKKSLGTRTSRPQELVWATFPESSRSQKAGF